MAKGTVYGPESRTFYDRRTGTCNPTGHGRVRIAPPSVLYHTGV